MRKKKLIILIIPIKLRKIDLDRYDVLELEKTSKIKVEIHEVINFLYPGFEKAFMNTIKDKRLKSFNSYKSWKIHFENNVTPQERYLNLVGQLSDYIYRCLFYEL